MTSSPIIEFHNFMLSLMAIQNFSAAFWSLMNFRNFVSIQKWWQKIKESYHSYLCKVLHYGNLCENIRLTSGWKTTLLTSVFFVRTSVFLASWYYADSIDMDVADVRWVDFLPPQANMEMCTTIKSLPFCWTSVTETKRFINSAPGWPQFW